MPALEGVHFRDGFQKMRLNEQKHISKAEHESRNIPLTTNLINLLNSKLFGLSIKEKTKFLSDVSMSTVEPLP